MTQEKEWYSIEIPFKNSAIKDILAEFAFTIGCLGTEDLDDSIFLEPGMNDYEGLQGIKLYFPNDLQKEEIVFKLQSEIKELKSRDEELFLEEEEIENFKIDQIPYKNWREEWKKSYSPLKAGCFLVVPSWMKDDKKVRDQLANEGLMPIYIEPKMAFGTGTHETTRLMLQMITATGVQNMKVFDAGTGSGILSIAMAKLKAREVTAVDIEDESIDNARENIELNDKVGYLRSVINVSKVNNETYSEKNNSRFDLICANINRVVLESLLSDFIRITKNQGLILFSGILVEELGKFREFVTKNSNLKEYYHCELNEWASLIYRIEK